jgi:hypothetical protein
LHEQKNITTIKKDKLNSYLISQKLKKYIKMKEKNKIMKEK